MDPRASSRYRPQRSAIMEAAGEREPGLTARNVVSTRSDATTSTTGQPHALWFAAESATAAVTGGLLAAFYIASVIGWPVEGRAPAPAPASGWAGIVMGVVVGSGTGVNSADRCTADRSDATGAVRDPGVGGAHTVRPQRESPVRASCDRAIRHDRHPPLDHKRRSNELHAMASHCWRRQRSHRCFIGNWLTGRRVGPTDSMRRSSFTCDTKSVSSAVQRILDRSVVLAVRRLQHSATSRGD